MPKQVSKCPVCNEEFLGRYSRKNLDVHYWRSHTEYPAWIRRHGIRMVMVLTPAVILLVLLLLYFGPNSDLGLFSLLGYVAFAGIVVVNFGMKIKRFKQHWKEEHGSLFPSM